MADEDGPLYRLVGGGVSRFRVVESGVDGDRDLVMVETVEDSPGKYPFLARLSLLVAVDE